MLFDNADGKADHKDKNRKKDLPDQLQRAVFPGNGENCNGISHVQGRADACTGVKGIDKAHQSCQYILAGKNLRSEILSVRINNITEHSNSLGAHNEIGQRVHAGVECFLRVQVLFQSVLRGKGLIVENRLQLFGFLLQGSEIPAEGFIIKALVKI